MNSFEIYLQENNYSANTIRSYLYAVRQCRSMYSELSHSSLNGYREYLLRHYSVSTANIRINAINTYLAFLGSDVPHMKGIKTGQKQFYDDIITDDEYRFLKAGLYQEKDLRDYFLVRILASTGMRVSELLTVEADDIRCGYKDVVSKGNKMRRVYFPKKMRREAEEWLRWSRIVHGKIFLNRKGLPLTPSGIRFILRQCAERYGIPPGHVHPHAFRHRYALNFLRQNSDITLLADLLGHENIETTRLYLKRTQEEQRRIVDEIVNW